MKVIQKVLSLTRKEEPQLNFFVVATNYDLIFIKLWKVTKISVLLIYAGEIHPKVRGIQQI